MNVLELATLTVTGFVACAEFGSYAFVHPVLRRLPLTERPRGGERRLNSVPVRDPVRTVCAGAGPDAVRLCRCEIRVVAYVPPDGTN